MSDAIAAVIGWFEAPAEGSAGGSTSGLGQR